MGSLPGLPRQVRAEQGSFFSVGVITAARRRVLTHVTPQESGSCLLRSGEVITELVALLQLPRRACGGAQLWEGGVLSGKTSSFQGPAPPRLPRQDQLEKEKEKDLLGLPAHLGHAFLESWEKEGQGSRKAYGGEQAGNSSGTRMNGILVCSAMC